MNILKTKKNIQTLKTSHLSVGEFIVWAGGQQDTSACVGELAVVYLFLVFLPKLSDKSTSLNTPQLQHKTNFSFSSLIFEQCWSRTFPHDSIEWPTKKRKVYISNSLRLNINKKKKKKKIWSKLALQNDIDPKIKWAQRQTH